MRHVDVACRRPFSFTEHLKCPLSLISWCTRGNNNRTVINREHATLLLNSYLGYNNVGGKPRDSGICMIV